MKRYHQAIWLFIVFMIATMLPLPLMAQEVKVDLALTLIPGNYLTDIKAGQENKSFLEIRNIGSKAVTNIKLSADVPEGWTVEFKPDKIEYLSSGDIQTVDLNIQPANKTPDGGYRVSLIAEGNEIRKVSSIWVTVSTPATFWLWVGAAIAIVVLAAFAVIFLRFGRQ